MSTTTTFAFMPAYGGDEREARLLARNLIQALEEWNAPRPTILVLHPNHTPPPVGFNRLPVRLVPFHLPEAFRAFPFAAKVFASARAEECADSDLLVWLDSDSLFLRAPRDFQLPPKISLAACPVHLKNISSPAAEPLDRFWQQVYACTPAKRIFPVVTRVDQLTVRAHFNAGCLVVRCAQRLLSAWKSRFEQEALREVYQAFYEQHPLYRIFIHQAVLSAVLLERLTQDEILLLPEQYNYPVFLQKRFDLTLPADLVSLRYDQFSFFADTSWKSLLPGRTDRIVALLGQL